MSFLILFSFILLLIILLLIYEISNITFKFLVEMIGSIILKSSKSDSTKNYVLSILYFFKDTAPNVSSVSIVALVITPNGTTFQLIALFFLGIIIKEIARLLISKFCEKVQNLKDSLWVEKLLY